jgi:GNAT superfamily N-acetyltransferase
MEATRFEDPQVWLDAVRPLLLRDEARHDLPLGIASTLIRHPSVYPDKELWAVDRARDPVGAALQTPPHNLVLGWLAAFDAEVVPPEIRGDPGERARRATTVFSSEEGGFWLWEQGGRAVSMTGVAGLTPNGIRIGPVYTPPDLRGHGYATSLVASVSSDQLSNGRRFCFLHTDLANPTSNAIYQRIGYERVCDSVVLAFEAS